MATRLNRIFTTDKIKFLDLRNQIITYLVDTYSQTASVFTKASPFGQLVDVIEQFSQLLFLYLEDAVVENNILTATKERSIYGLARLVGHNPTRALSAQGTIQIKLKPGAQADINASYVLVLDKTKLTCTNNGLDYFIQITNSLGNVKIESNSTNFYPFKIIQGVLDSQSVIGDGTALQTYNFQSDKPIENDLVYVFVNGEPYEIVDSIYDMTKDERQCLVKTGISGGIDIIFGNEDYGTMPIKGSQIKVDYVKTDGYGGNIFGKSNTLEFKWSDPAYSNTGEEIDLNEFFLTEVLNPIILGADTEAVELTRLIAPKISRSLVLANPDNYIYFLSRFNYAYVDAYTTKDDGFIEDDNVIYLFLLPDISKRLSSNAEYFTTPEENFYLDQYEKDAVISFINQSGRQIISTELNVVDPYIKKYALNVFIRVFDDVDQPTVKQNVINQITEYLIKVTRRDRIPKSDIVAIVEGITGIDSVDVSFVSQENEDAIVDGFYYKRIRTSDAIRGTVVEELKKITVPSGTDPNLGMDEFGDVLIDQNMVPIIRGGWYDRYGNYYEEGLSESQFASLNVVIKSVIPRTLATRITQKAKESIK
jgi:hypothetical protein